MSKEKRMLGNYEVTQSIYVGDKEVVLAVDKKEQYLYLYLLTFQHSLARHPVKSAFHGWMMAK